MNLIFENVEPQYIPLFKALTKVLKIKMRKVENVERRTKHKHSSENMKEAGLE